MGRLIDEKLAQIQVDLPIGLDLHRISWQSTVVQESISGFVISMIESVVIVLIVLLIPSALLREECKLASGHSNTDHPPKTREILPRTIAFQREFGPYCDFFG